MLKYAGKRILMLIPILIIVSILAFGLVRLMPGNAEMAYLQASGIPPSDKAIKNISKELGLNKPLIVQYGDWIGKAIKLDFGKSYIAKKIVKEEILGAFKNTVSLAGISTFIIIIISVPMGVLSAVRANKELDHVNRILAFAGSSMPSFWLGPLLVQVFCLALGWLPVQGIGGWQHMVLPAFTLAVLYIATYSRTLRNSLLENMNRRFVTYGRARGLAEQRIVLHHVLRNSLIPAVTSFGVNFGHMLAGTTIVEVIFSWPGLGRLVIEAIQERDYPMIQAYVVLMAVVFIIVNLITDLVTVALDPRMRETL